MQDFLSGIARGLPATVPFVGPEALERRLGLRFKARIGANESTFGPSPAVIEAMGRAAAESWARSLKPSTTCSSRVGRRRAGMGGT